MKIIRSYENADPQDVVIVLGVYVLIISIIVFCTGLLFGQINVRAEAQYTNTKARCKNSWWRDGLFIRNITGREGNMDETG